MTCCSTNASKLPAVVAGPIAPPAGAVASPKVHVHLHVPDLRDAVAFYRAFFGSNPVKLKPGYAKFLPIWSPLNLALGTLLREPRHGRQPHRHPARKPSGRPGSSSARQGCRIAGARGDGSHLLSCEPGQVLGN